MTLLTTIPIPGVPLARSLDLFDKRFGRCASCPEDADFNEIAGDSRCNMTSNFGIIDGNGCSTCGCQRCPDLKYYYNSVTDYCHSVSSDQCGIYPQCLQYCGVDSQCQALDFDIELDPGKGSCICKCQKCSDGKVYPAAFDHTKVSTLTEEEEKECPHILYPPTPAQDLCSK